MYSISRVTALLVFILAPLPFGSTELVWICAWNVLMAFSLLTADVSKATPAHARLLLPMFITIVLVGALVGLQTWPDPPLGAVDPSWKTARGLLGIAAPDRISLTARVPWLALGYPLLFTLSLARAVLLAVEAPDARNIIRILGWAAFCYALYGILAEIADPGGLLFRRKEAYLGVATGTFVNRNTAATFWGSGALLFLVPLLRLVHRRDRPDAAGSDRPIAVVLHLLNSQAALVIGFAVCTVAAAMTGSRAGLLLTILSFFIAATLYLVPLNVAGLRRWGLLAGAAVAAIAILQLIGGAVAGRILSYGLIDDLRLGAYRSTFQMIRDHPLFGVGLGNFEVVFPAFRVAELGSQGVWDRAHSTPIELAAELGIPAAMLITATCVWYLYHLLNGSLLRRRDRYIPIIGATVAILGVLHSCIDFSLQIPGFGVFFAAVTGCGLAQCISSATEKTLRD